MLVVVVIGFEVSKVIDKMCFPKWKLRELSELP
jgi:hypothetical protein